MPNQRDAVAIRVAASQSFDTITTVIGSRGSRIESGSILVEPGSVLAAQRIESQLGSIQGQVRVGSALRRHELIGELRLQNFASNVPVEVSRGLITIDDSDKALPATTSEVILRSRSNAAIRLGARTTTDATLRLNNGSGFNYGGALFVENDGCGSLDMIVRGDIDLGGIGAHLGGQDTIRIEGGLLGGDLHLDRKASTTRLVLSKRTAEYTGKTNIYSGAIELSEQGRLANTVGIVMHSPGEILLDSGAADSTAPGVTLIDRVADNVPITLNGGSVSAWPTEPGTRTRERLGTVHMARGVGSIHGTSYTSRGGAVATAELSIGALTRDPGAIVLAAPFENRSLPSHDSSFSSARPLKIDAMPPVVNGILPPWLLARPTQFATAEPNGIEGYEGPIVGLAAADATSIVRPGRETLDRDLTVHA